MWHLRHLRCYLDLDSAILLATALVSSRFDNCNSRLYGITDTDLTKLRRIQNQLARLVTMSLHLLRLLLLPLLRSLHCLSVKFKIFFKIQFVDLLKA